jgi:hypothetical protein
LINSHINTRGNWENSKLCENTSPFGRRVSTQFLVFPISTRVDITVYINTENVLYLIPTVIAMKLVMRQFMGYRPLAETLSSDWLRERDYVRTPQSRELHFLFKLKSNKSVIIFYSMPQSRLDPQWFRFYTGWRKKKLPCLIYFNLKTKRAITPKLRALHSVLSNLNFDIRPVHFHAILTERAAFKLE